MVRAGHVSNRTKMRTTAAVTINTTNVNATGQEKRPDVSGCNIGCWVFDVRPWALSSIQPKKKYRPPRPMGVKGGCSPHNNLPTSGQLLPELKRCRNKNFYKYTALPRSRGQPSPRP